MSAAPHGTLFLMSAVRTCARKVINLRRLRFAPAANSGGGGTRRLRYAAAATRGGGCGTWRLRYTAAFAAAAVRDGLTCIFIYIYIYISYVIPPQIQMTSLRNPLWLDRSKIDGSKVA